MFAVFMIRKIPGYHKGGSVVDVKSAALPLLFSAAEASAVGWNPDCPGGNRREYGSPANVKRCGMAADGSEGEGQAHRI